MPAKKQKSTASKELTKQTKTAKKASKEMMYTDGKATTSNEKERLNDLELLLNPSILTNHFKASTEQELDSKMADMSMPELQSLAVQVGVFPSGNRTTLKNKLRKEFKNTVFSGKGRVMQSERPMFDFNSLTEEQKKLFKEI